jgi:hypothetical protein
MNGGGGGGGYTNTVKNVSVEPKQEISVSVGGGGSGGRGIPGHPFSYSNTASPTNGGSSSIGTYCSANGGYSGGWYDGKDKTGSSSACGNGGSGGAGCSWYYSTIKGFYNYRLSPYGYTTGAKDGGTTAVQEVFFYYKGYNSNEWVYEFSNPFNWGYGQGTTTRYFGESGGTLYASGGDSNTVYYTYRSANTGDGGNPSSQRYNDDYSIQLGLAGASGVAIIRWSDQK